MFLEHCSQRLPFFSYLLFVVLHLLKDPYELKEIVNPVAIASFYMLKLKIRHFLGIKNVH